MKWLGRAGWTIAFVAVALAAGGPPVMGWWIAARLLPRLSARVGRPVTVERVRARWGKIELYGLTVGGGAAEPPVYVPRLQARYHLRALLSGRVEVPEVVVEHARVELVRGGPEDNISAILERLSAPREGSASPGARLHVDSLKLVDCAIAVADETLGEGEIATIDGELWREGAGELRLAGVGAHVSAARVGAERVTIGLELRRGRLHGLPNITVEGGTVSPLRGLDLTGIAGTIAPDPFDEARAVVDVRGSYGGAGMPLWNATGWLRPQPGEGKLKVRAERFKLAQLDSVLKREGGVVRVFGSHDAEVDARLDLDYRAGLIKYQGAFHVAGLTVAHPMLGPVPVHHISFDAHAAGSLEPGPRRLSLDAQLDYRRVHATLRADVENIGNKPRFGVVLKISPMPCQTALQALPPELVPSLQGFKLAGTFSTDLHLGVDMNDLQTEGAVDLGGLVGIEGCKVLEAPPAAMPERLLGTFQQTVESERGHFRTFLVGPENPDYVPYTEISPHLVNSIMTTEDSNFFKHRGFIAREFRSALQQNLQRGYFRLGASSITMQMIKNVLLTREKTLSRKLQELFLTWHIEHSLTKERILEIYFNVIEFGPDIFGIARAARHYFGKSAKDLAPEEGAFFSSILPNPKKHYVLYCNKEGVVDARWFAYLKRIMTRSHERGRLTDAEFQLATTTPPKFDRKEALPERDCYALVKRLTTPPVPPGTQAAPAAQARAN